MAEIFTRKGEKILVDEEDYALVAKIKWYIDINGYAAGHIRLPDGRRTALLMHRYIMGLAYGDRRQVDHINACRSDNTRSNLRVCVKAENMHNRGQPRNNTSGFKGVSFDKRYQKYRAQICVHGRHIHIGYFATPEAAYAAYCVEAERRHGEFANFGVPA